MAEHGSHPKSRETEGVNAAVAAASGNGETTAALGDVLNETPQLIQQFIDSVNKSEKALVHELLAKCPSLAHAFVDEASSLPLHLAAHIGNDPIEGQKHHLDNLFSLIAQGNFHECVPHLAAAGGDPNVQDSFGVSALHEACALGSAETVTALLAVGASPMTVTRWKQTPLHMCAIAPNTRPQTVFHLVESGTDIAARDARQHSALQVAASTSNLCVFSCLMVLGSPINEGEVADIRNARVARNGNGVAAEQAGLVQDYLSATHTAFDQGGSKRCQSLSSLCLATLRHEYEHIHDLLLKSDLIPSLLPRTVPEHLHHLVTAIRFAVSTGYIQRNRLCTDLNDTE
eukprot:m.264120 g.264120  ORF g.264120 m.264120 type:complete len:344 (+) comp15609_c4_seq1:31-1062(+)